MSSARPSQAVAYVLHASTDSTAAARACAARALARSFAATMLEAHVFDSRAAGMQADTQDGFARSGGLDLVDGNVTVNDTSFIENAALSHGGGQGVGGSFTVVSGIFLMSNGTRLVRGQATTEGASFAVQGGIASYALPTPPGHWVPALECLVYRRACPRNDMGFVTQPLCGSTARDCSLSTDEMARINGFNCRALMVSQPCDWRAAPQLVGRVLHALPQMPNEADYPFQCAAGLVGGTLQGQQGSPLCGGPAPAGTYQPVPTGVSTITCPAGSYCPAGASLPLSCPEGTYSNTAGIASASQCTVCPTGHACPAGSTAQQPCRPGTYSPSPGRGACDYCPAGSFQSSPASISCQGCPAGSFCELGASVPLLCAAGSYRSAANAMSQSDCAACPSGNECATGSTAPTSCVPGTFAEAAGQRQCTNCPVGKFQTWPSRTNCISCAAGQYCLARSTAPLTCAPGSYSAIAEQGSCVSCLAGSYQSSSGATACIDCPAGSWCAAGASAPVACGAGSYRSAVSATSVALCLGCPAGSACVTGAMVPVQCSAGSFSAAGSGACVRCEAGTYQELEGQTFCAICPPGKFCPAGSATPQYCEGGTFSGATGLVSSSQCHRVTGGFWAPTGSTLPEECFPGFYCPGFNDDDVNLQPGSKPIIIDMGATTQTSNQTVEVNTTLSTVGTNLTLDADLTTFNETAVRLALAELYAVPAELISLAVSAGSIVVSVSIALQSTGAAMPVLDAQAVLAQVDRIGEANITASLGLNATVSAAAALSSTTYTTVTQVLTVRRVSCFHGFWCAAGVATPCEVNTYNPSVDQTLASACIPCPANSHTDGTATIHEEDCICNNGFVRVIEMLNGTNVTSCQCPAGHKFEEAPPEMRIHGPFLCARCETGYFKAEVRNGRCNACPGFPLTATISDGAISEEECVCAINYFEHTIDDNFGQRRRPAPLVNASGALPSNASASGTSGALPSNASASGIVVNSTVLLPSSDAIVSLVANRSALQCQRCPSSVDCAAAGHVTETLLVQPGFWRVNTRSIEVLPCAVAGSRDACLGTNTSTGDHISCAEGHDPTKPFCATCMPGFIPGEGGVCEECEGSPVLTFLVPGVSLAALFTLVMYLGCTGEKNRDKLKALVLAATAVVDQVATHGKVRSTGEEVDVGRITEGWQEGAHEHAQQRATAAAVATATQVKTGAKRRLSSAERSPSASTKESIVAKQSIEDGGVASNSPQDESSAKPPADEKGAEGQKVSKDTAEAAPSLVPVSTQRSVCSRCLRSLARLLARLRSFVSRSYVKIRILISLAQVLQGIGTVFDIPYPEFYTGLMDWYSALQLDLFTVMPLSCVYNTNFHTELLVRTLWPLVTILLLWTAGRALLLTQDWRWAGDTCYSAIFFIAFLVYPGNSAKLFATFQCYPLDGKIQPDDFTFAAPQADVMREGTSWLKADWSINCADPLHVTMMWYAFGMLLVYPLGIPLSFAYLLFWRHSDSLHELSRREQRATAHEQLNLLSIEASSALKIKARRAKLSEAMRERKKAQESLERLQRAQRRASCSPTQRRSSLIPGRRSSVRPELSDGEASAESSEQSVALEQSIARAAATLQKLDENVQTLRNHLSEARGNERRPSTAQGRPDEGSGSKEGSERAAASLKDEDRIQLPSSDSSPEASPSRNGKKRCSFCNEDNGFPARPSGKIATLSPLGATPPPSPPDEAPVAAPSADAPAVVELGVAGGRPDSVPLAPSAAPCSLDESLHKELASKLLRVMDLFRSADANHDGFISLGEFRRAFKDVGIEASEEELTAFFSSMDVDASKSISYHELSRALRKAAASMESKAHAPSAVSEPAVAAPAPRSVHVVAGQRAPSVGFCTRMAGDVESADEPPPSNDPPSNNNSFTSRILPRTMTRTLSASGLVACTSGLTRTMTRPLPALVARTSDLASVTTRPLPRGLTRVMTGALSAATEAPKKVHRSIRSVLRGKARVAGKLQVRTKKLHEETTTVEGVRRLAKSGRLPAHVQKLIEGYDLRCYWFELFECARKILLVGMPVFFEMGSVAQLSYGLLVSFISFGAFALLKPYASDSDDRLAQLCQVQVFFALVASILSRWRDANPDPRASSNLDIVLCIFAALPVVFAGVVHAVEEGLYDYFDTTWIRPARVLLAPRFALLRSRVDALQERVDPLSPSRQSRQVSCIAPAAS